jgi:CMP-N-acetylneuraminic acid synthetase
MSEEIRKVILETVESVLDAQLRAVRRLRREGEEHSAQSSAEKARHKRRSQLSLVEDLLVEAAEPLHISVIIEQAKSRFNQVLDRESLVSALTKRVNRKDRFVRTGPNTFGLRPSKPVKEDGAAT